MDSKVISVNFGQDGQYEYIDVRCSPYVGLNDYKKWPTLEDILGVGQKLADRIVKVRRKALDDCIRLSHIGYELEYLTGISEKEIRDQALKQFTTILYNRKWAAERIRLAVVPDIPRDNYTVDPFVGWACLVEGDYTGHEDVDKMIDKYMYDIIWKRGVCRE